MTFDEAVSIARDLNPKITTRGNEPKVLEGVIYIETIDRSVEVTPRPDGHTWIIFGTTKLDVSSRIQHLIVRPPT